MQSEINLHINYLRTFFYCDKLTYEMRMQWKWMSRVINQSLVEAKKRGAKKTQHFDLTYDLFFVKRGL